MSLARGRVSVNTIVINFLRTIGEWGDLSGVNFPQGERLRVKGAH